MALFGALGTVCVGSSPAVASAAGTPRAAVVDDRGRAIADAATPSRIVSLLPSLTESVCAIGACARLVGTDRFSNWPEAVRALPKLGGLDDAQVERIVGLRPDLVLASTSARVAGRLESLGIAVVALDSERHADVAHALRLLGDRLDARDGASRTLARIDADLRRAASLVPETMRGRRVYVEVDSGPYAASEASFVGETLARLGLANAVPAALGAFPKLNPEFVVRTRPDIVVATRANVAHMRSRPGWDSLPALRRGHVCAFEPARFEVLVRPGPRLGEAALMLADCVRGLPPFEPR